MTSVGNASSSTMCTSINQKAAATDVTLTNATNSSSSAISSTETQSRGEKRGTLQRLPQELIDQIMEYLFDNLFPRVSEADKIFFQIQGQRDPYWGNHRWGLVGAHVSTAKSLYAFQPAICCTNRYFRSKYLPLFYQRNTFLAECCRSVGMARVKRRLRVIGDESVAHLRTLVLDGMMRIPHDGEWFEDHESAREPVPILLDLKAGTLDTWHCTTMELDEFGHESFPEQDDIQLAIADWAGAFKALIQAKNGKPLNVQDLSGVLDGYEELCRPYPPKSDVLEFFRDSRDHHTLMKHLQEFQGFELDC